MHESSDVLADVRRALGRPHGGHVAPSPPAIPDDIARLMPRGADLSKEFVRRATENKIKVESVSTGELISHLIEYFRDKQCKRIALPVSPRLDRLNVKRDLAAEGFEVKSWDEISLDELYDFDASVTDAYAAVAEIGGIVVRSSPQHGRALSLVPMVHVAILEQTDFIPDLIDLFEKMGRDPQPTGTVIITGPSKTADIEMNLVTGVHGPGFVKVFILP